MDIHESTRTKLGAGVYQLSLRHWKGCGDIAIVEQHWGVPKIEPPLCELSLEGIAGTCPVER